MPLPSTSLQSDAGPLGLEEGLRSYATRMLAASLHGEVLGVKRIAEFARTCAQGAGRECSDPEGIAEAFICMIRGWYVNVILTNRDVPAAERERWVRRAGRMRGERGARGAPRIPGRLHARAVQRAARTASASSCSSGRVSSRATHASVMLCP